MADEKSNLKKILESVFIQFVPTLLLLIFVVISYIFSTNLQRGWLLIGASFMIALALVVGVCVSIIGLWVKKKSTNFVPINLILLVINVACVFTLPAVLRF